MAGFSLETWERRTVQLISVGGAEKVNRRLAKQNAGNERNVKSHKDKHKRKGDKSLNCVDESKKDVSPIGGNGSLLTIRKTAQQL